MFEKTPLQHALPRQILALVVVMVLPITVAADGATIPEFESSRFLWPPRTLANQNTLVEGMHINVTLWEETPNDNTCIGLIFKTKKRQKRSDHNILKERWEQCKRGKQAKLYVVIGGKVKAKATQNFQRLTAYFYERTVEVSIFSTVNDEKSIYTMKIHHELDMGDMELLTKTTVITNPRSNPSAKLISPTHYAMVPLVRTETTFGDQNTRVEHEANQKLTWIFNPTTEEKTTGDTTEDEQIATTPPVESWVSEMLTHYPMPTIVVATVVLLLLIISAFSVGTCILARFPAKTVVIVTVPCSICSRKIECFSNEDDEVFVSSNEERGGDYKKLVDLHRSLSKGRPEGGLIHCTFCDEARLQGEDPAAYRDLGIELAQRRVSTVSEKYQSTEPLEETMIRPCETQSECGQDPNSFHVDFHDLGTELVNGIESTVAATCDQPL